MSHVTDGDPIDASAARASGRNHQGSSPTGRIQNVSPNLVPLLRNPTGAVAGDLCPIDRAQIGALWAASAYPADVWRNMSETERSSALVGEMLELVARIARVDVPPVTERPRRSRRHTLR